MPTVVELSALDLATLGYGRARGKPVVFGQVPSVEAKYPKVGTPYWFKPVPNQEALLQGINALPSSWRDKIRPIIVRPDPVTAGDAKSFLISWANATWNARLRSEAALKTLKDHPLRSVRQFTENLAIEWTTHLREERGRWDARFPAYQELIKHLDGLGSEQIDPATRFEVARQAASFAGRTSHIVAFMQSEVGLISRIAEQDASLAANLKLTGEALGASIEFVTDAVAAIVEPVLKAAGKGIRAILGSIPWWVYGLGGVVAFGALGGPRLITAWLARRRAKAAPTAA